MGDSWFTASPGPSQTGRLWAGWGCTPVLQSNHGTQDKPAITTHTQGDGLCRDRVLHLLGLHHLAISNRWILAQQKPLTWRVAEVDCYIAKLLSVNID